MKRFAIWSLVTLALGGPGASAFTSGSTGVAGPIDVLTGTQVIPLPADGVIHATTITVAAGATLRFTRNGLNTPVFLLATGDVNVGGLVEVNGVSAVGGVAGQGGPGGFDGGNPGNPPGDGGGPGGGRGGIRDFGGEAAWGGGAYGCTGTVQHRPRDGQPYGNAALLDLVGGSGGGGSDIAGGGGGGAILIASDTRIVVSGTIAANGGSGPDQYGGSGSGGAIRLVAPAVAGTGLLSVRGGSAGSGVEAGPGRIRVDALDRRQLAVTASPECAITTGSILIARPQGLGSLSFVSVAGQAIEPGAGAEVVIPIDQGAPSAQSIVVEARDHHATLPIEIVIQPPTGPRVIVEADIPASDGAPVQLDVPVTLPAGSPLRVFAWTR